MKTKTKTKKKKTRGSSLPSQTDVPESSDFHAAVAKIAVAQICKSVGYRGAQTSALETLTEVAVRYLQSLAKSAATSACSTGRTQCNLLDIVFASEDLHSDIGFYGNSDPNRKLHSFSDSSILHDTMKFVYKSGEIPFAQPLPRRCHTLPPLSSCFSRESAKWKHIPRWLPAFPEITNDAEKTAAPAAGEGEGETAWEKKMRWIESNRKISKLPEKRKKVSFKISGNGGGIDSKNEIAMEYGVDLRNVVFKGGKRISFQIYDENNDANPKQSKKMKLEESSRTNMIMKTWLD